MNKNTFKVMNYINKNFDSVDLSKLKTKYKNLSGPNLNDILNFLCSKNFGYYSDYASQDSYGQPLDPQTFTLGILGDDKLASFKAARFVDKFARWTSVTALIISFASLAFAYCSQK